jgi:hypothetical protein
MNENKKDNYSSRGNISANEIELTKIFNEQYIQIFHNIFNFNQYQFINLLINRVNLNIKLLKKKFDSSLIQKNQKNFTKQYQTDNNLLSSLFDDLSMLEQIDQFYIKKFNYFIHCNKCNFALHTCKEKLLFYNDFIFCLKCKQVYKKNFMELYCNECNCNYYSKIRENKNPNLSPFYTVTLKTYHCDKNLNEPEAPIQCFKCGDNLYTDITKNNDNILQCLNCNIIIDVNKINFKCIFCEENFKSKFKIFNEIKNNNIIFIINTISSNQYAIPDLIYDKFCDCDISKHKHFIHSDNCDGLLYQNFFNEKKTIVCNKCFQIFYFNNFVWLCPICGSTFKTKDKSAIERKKSFDSPVKKKNELSLSALYQKIFKSSNNLVNINDNYNIIINNNNEKNVAFVSPQIKNRTAIKLNDNLNFNQNNLSDLFKLNSELSKKANPILPKFTFTKTSKFFNIDSEQQEQNNDRKNFIHRKYSNNFVKKNYFNSNESTDANSNKNSNESKTSLNKQIPIYQSINKPKINSPFNSDDYNIIKCIGEGTFGKIYLSEHPITHKKYALKKISATSEYELLDKKKEYELLINLYKHNKNLNIIKIYGVQTKRLDQLTFVMYILMELANSDWEKEIRYRAQIGQFYSEIELKNILFNLVYTFADLQKKGVSHRDVKPQNILICKGGVYKIGDFGEFKKKSQYNMYDVDTKTQTIRGTELFMSPIVFSAYRNILHNIDANYNAYKNDVFSLGLCIYYAANLSYQPLYDIREIYDNLEIRRIVESYMYRRYSRDFINLLILMLQVKEKKRPDFIELEYYIKSNF